MIPSQEDVDEAIEKLANLIVRKYGMAEPAILALEGCKPFAPMIKTMAFVGIFPYVSFLEVLPGLDRMDASLMKYSGILDKYENVERLIRRIEEISKEMKEEVGKAIEENSTPSIFRRLRSWLRRHAR